MNPDAKVLDLQQVKIMKLSFRRVVIFVILTQSILIIYLQCHLKIKQAGYVGTPTSTKQGELFDEVNENLPNEPIDVVFTWVNGTDPRFLDQLYIFGMGMGIKDDVNGKKRFADKSELKYSLRSIEKNMPWIRHVFVVTNGQVPSWLNLDNGLVTVVTHEALFPNKSMLPTFSSPAIETNLHRIPGLSKKFLYFNDDLMIGRPVDLATFFTPADGIRLYWDFSVPPCAKSCPWSKVNDGHCDVSCYLPECQMDGNDCITPPTQHPSVSHRCSQNKTAYNCSVQHTNRVLNTLFGFEERKIIPHMPILIDRDVMTDAWRELHVDLTNTSSHRFRDPFDLQFQMFYAYYLHSKKIGRSLLEVLTKKDVNLDGFIDTLELRTMSAKHYHGTPTTELNRVVAKCITNKTSEEEQEMVKIGIKMLAKCKSLKNYFENSLMQQPKYKHVMVPVIGEDFFYSFLNFQSNLTNVINVLNDLRMKPRTFICLNDDLNYNPAMHEVNVKIYREFARFYESMFPFPSRYELPPGKVNKFSYIQERNVSRVEFNTDVWSQYSSPKRNELETLFFAHPQSQNVPF